MAIKQPTVDALLVSGVTAISVWGTIRMMRDGADGSAILTWAIAPTALYTALSAGVHALTGRYPLPPSGKQLGNQSVGYPTR